MKQEDTRQKILDKALELFAAKGYDSVSVGEIAQAVGIKAPSLYNHFPGKQAIFDAIVEAIMPAVRDSAVDTVTPRTLARSTISAASSSLCAAICSNDFVMPTRT